MKNTEFNNSITRTLDAASMMLTRKSAGYSTEDDRLHNFRTAAALNGCTMEQALWGMLTKHIVSIRDMVLSGESYSADVWDEKVGDAINYLAILKAITTEDVASDAALASLRQKLVYTPETDDSAWTTANTHAAANLHPFGIEVPSHPYDAEENRPPKPHPATSVKSAYTNQINTDLDSIRRVADKQNAQQQISHTAKKEL